MTSTEETLNRMAMAGAESAIRIARETGKPVYMQFNPNGTYSISASLELLAQLNNYKFTMLTNGPPCPFCGFKITQKVAEPFTIDPGDCE